MAFEVYVQQVLLPTLAPGDTVLLDNLSVHKVKPVSKTLADHQVTLTFLPPYSPELSPIELAWSKIKAELCTTAARTFDNLVTAVAQALATVSPHDT